MSSRAESSTAGRRTYSSGWASGWPWYAALAWSAGYAVLATVWSFGGPGYPFGDGDPEGADMGSVLFASRAAATAPILAGCALVGVLVALAMLRRTSRPIVHSVGLVAAWLFAAALILVIADVRVLQNTTYALLFVFAKLDWTVLHQGVLVLGGLCWAAAAVAYFRRHRGGCQRCGRTGATTGRPERIVRWGKISAYTAFLAPLPYAITRAAWALDIPLGLDELPAATITARVGELGLATLALGGGVLALGLVRRWGEIWPRWIPVLAGRRIPVLVPVVPGLVVSILITVGALGVLRAELMAALGFSPQPTEPPTVTGWGAWAPGVLWPLWAVGLGLASLAYYYRRRGQCRACGLGTPSGVQSSG